MEKQKKWLALCFNSLLKGRCDELRPARAEFNDVPLYKIDCMCVLKRCFRAAHYRKKETFKPKGAYLTRFLAFEAIAMTHISAVTFAVVRKPGTRVFTGNNLRHRSIRGKYVIPPTSLRNFRLRRVHAMMGIYLLDPSPNVFQKQTTMKTKDDTRLCS